MALVLVPPYRKILSQLIRSIYTAWNPSDSELGLTLTNSNLTAASGGGQGVRSVVSKSSGKWYWEHRIDSFPGNSAISFGIADANLRLSWQWGTPAGTSKRAILSLFNQQNSNIYDKGSTITLTGLMGKAGDVVGIAVDFDNLQIRYFLNGVMIGGGPFSIPAGTYFAFTGDGSSGSLLTSTANFGATPFAYSVPEEFNKGLYSELPVVYATFAADKHPNVSVSSDGLTLTSNGGYAARAVSGKSSGKWYWEVLINPYQGSGGPLVGIASKNVDPYFMWDDTNKFYTWYTGQAQIIQTGNARAGYSQALVNDVIGIGLDLDNNKLRFWKNGVEQAPLDILADTYYPIYSDAATNYQQSVTFNFGSSAFKYPVPSGFDVLYTTAP